MKWISKIALGICLLPLALLVLLIALVAMPIVFVIELKEAMAFRRFKRKQHGRFYFICTKRHGWRNFLINNVVPVLPESVIAVWHVSHRDGSESMEARLTKYLQRSGIHAEARPCIVAVSRDGLRCKSLNILLQDYKTNSKRSDEVQRMSRKIVENEIASLRQEKK